MGAKLNFVAYYIIGLPPAALLAIYFGLSVVGLWIGMTLGLAVTSIMGIIIMFQSDWDDLVLVAHKQLADVTESY